MRLNKDKKEHTDVMLINERIRAPRVQLIDDHGVNHGVIERDRALQMAYEAQLDLVQLSPRGGNEVPIVKIMDHGKALYEKKKKKSEAKKHQKVIQIKEIKIRPKIGDHDYETKMKQAIQFLLAGKRVKITLAFRGREHVTKDQRGAELFDKVEETFAAHDLTDKIIAEKDSNVGKFWSRVYYLK